MNKQVQSSGYQRGRGCEKGKGGWPTLSDGWKLNFWYENTVVYREVEI